MPRGTGACRSCQTLGVIHTLFRDSMTLIAAFRSNGIPALVGDLLVTAGAIHGSRKKLLVVADNLAIAWTGHLIAAQIVCKALQGMSQNTTVSEDNLRALLTAFHPGDFASLQVTIVGWLIEPKRQLCFRWRSDYPSEVFYGDPMTDGSGSRLADQYIGTRGLVGDPPTEQPHHVAVSRALQVVAELMRDEMHGRPNTSSGFGYAYELVVLNAAGRFDYVDDVLYFGLCHQLTEAGRYVSSALFGPILKIEHREGLAVLYQFDPTTREETRDLITGPGFRRPELEEKIMLEICAKAKAFPLDSAYFCQLLQFDVPNFVTPRIVFLVDAAAGPGRPTIREDGSLAIPISRDGAENIFAAIRKDLETAQPREHDSGGACKPQ